MRLALAQTLFEELEHSLREALELADHFYREIATPPESGDSVELADFGSCSRPDGCFGSNGYRDQ